MIGSVPGCFEALVELTANGSNEAKEAATWALTLLLQVPQFLVSWFLVFIVKTFCFIFSNVLLTGNSGTYHWKFPSCHFGTPHRVSSEQFSENVKLIIPFHLLGRTETAKEGATWILSTQVQHPPCKVVTAILFVFRECLKT